MSDINNKKITVLLLVLISFLGIINLDKSFIGMGVANLIVDDKNFEIKNNEINLNSLTLRQKAAQMVFTLARVENKELLQKMNVGGIYFWEKEDRDIYEKEVKYFQEGMEIPFFIGIDLEGCWNPFRSFIDFPSFKDIDTEEEAYNIGVKHGKILRELGFNINFSPVVDKEDNIWNCRAFKENVAGNAAYYIRGLQGQGIIATAKHYPGNTLIGKDPHVDVAFSVVDDEDLKPFDWAINNDVKAVMINNLITRGKVNSNFKPSVVSGNVIYPLREKFNGLVLSDEVGMAGLKGFYGDERRMYIDLINAGNDVILDFRTEPWHLYKVISIIEDGVKNGEIKEERIDESVTRILKAKGFKVVKRKI